MTSSVPKRQRVSSNIITLSDATATEMNLLDKITCLTEEAAVLGSILQDPELFVQVSNQLQAGDFYNELHGFIWWGFDQLSSRREGIDILMVTNELEKQPRCSLKGDQLMEYLAHLIAVPADRNNIEHYARRVREAALKIRLLNATVEIKKTVFNEIDIDSIVDQSNSLLFQATEQHRIEETSAKAVISELWDSIEQLRQSGKSPTIATGFSQFDELTTGATPGEVMVLAGSEKMGKTTLLLSIIRNMVKSGKRVLLFTLEMSKAEIMRLLIAMESGIHRNVLKTGQLNQQEWELFVEAAGRVNSWPLDIEDQYPSLSPVQARRQVRFHQAQHAVDVVAIDGLWLMDSDDPELNTNNRPRAVHEITRDLTEQARLFNVPILITHQYKDLTGMTNRKAPSLYDLAESSGVRRNVQLIAGLHRSKQMSGGIEIDQTELHFLGDRNGRSQGQHIVLEYDNTYSCYKEGKSCPTNHPF